MKALLFSETPENFNRLSSMLKKLGLDIHGISFSEVKADYIYLANERLDYPSIVKAFEELGNKLNPDLYVLSSTKLGKEVASRFSQRTGLPCLTECLSVEIDGSSIIATRYSLGGKTLMKIKTDLPAVIAVVADAFEIEDFDFKMEKVDFEIKEADGINVISREEKRREKVGLRNADVVVCFGRGVRRKEDIELIEKLAEKLNAEIGCTRPISHDYRWLPEERMIGLSGEKISPKLLISIGVSGQIQHAVGIMNSKTVIAINNDENAPMKEYSDYYVVADLYSLIPELIKLL